MEGRISRTLHGLPCDIHHLKAFLAIKLGASSNTPLIRMIFRLLFLKAIFQKINLLIVRKKMAALRILGQPFSLFMLFACYLEYIILPSNFLPSSKEII